MAQEFIYFAGSLPTLVFGEKPAVSLAAFDEDAARLLDAGSAGKLCRVVLYTQEADGLPRAAQKFYDWENALRNSWLDVRKKFRADAVDFKQGDPDFYSEIAPALNQAAMTADLMEAEKIIDRLRWNQLDNLASGHYFDMDFLAIYRIKLQILAKYEIRTVENGNQVLEAVLEALLVDK